MDGEIVNKIDYKDTVRMVAPGLESGTFEVYDDDSSLLSINFEEIRTGIEGEIVDGNWVGEWTISEEDLDTAGEDDYDDFVFRVGDMISGYLEVKMEYEDDPTVFNLDSPLCGEYHGEGDKIWINVTAEDGDDIIEGNVTIGDEFREFANGGIRFQYDLTGLGDDKVWAQMVNSRGHYISRRANIMILDKDDAGVLVDGMYVAACISEPEDFARVFTNEVFFNASTTRGVRVDSGSVEILYPWTYDFNWSWVFPRDNIVKYFGKVMDKEAYEFTVNFPKAGGNWAELDVGL